MNFEKTVNFVIIFILCLLILIALPIGAYYGCVKSNGKPTLQMKCYNISEIKLCQEGDKLFKVVQEDDNKKINFTILQQPK